MNPSQPAAPQRIESAPGPVETETAPLDAARAARLKAAIAAGQYPVDPAKLAERLVALGLFPGEGR